LWKGHAGALPEDVLLRGRTYLSWVLPALACGGLRVQWPGEKWAGAGEPQVRIQMHAPAGVEAGGLEAETASQNEIVRRILAGEPLANVQGTAATQRMIDRVTGVYAHEVLAKRPAVLTVSQLKSGEDEDRATEEAPAMKLFALHAEQGAGGTSADEARLRGVATHRILELLDFAECGSAEAVGGAIRRLVAEKRVSEEDAARADSAGIVWSLTESEAGKRLLAGARQRDGIEIRREIAFTWLAPPRQDAGESGDPADWPTIRGVIDVLLVDRAAGSAEILDYKTDSAFTWEAHAADYERQMRYYLQAAGEILGFPVTGATLLFLTPRRERAVTLPE
jgi:ATP-dependent exoDNAse (exonuclease V) beta subunit